jgi:hypothetical protein
MKLNDFSTVEVDAFQETSTLQPEKQPEPSSLDPYSYMVKSSLGMFAVFSFLDAVYLARQIVTIRGCWAVIQL